MPKNFTIVRFVLTIMDYINMDTLLRQINVTTI